MSASLEPIPAKPRVPWINPDKPAICAVLIDVMKSNGNRYEQAFVSMLEGNIEDPIPPYDESVRAYMAQMPDTQASKVMSVIEPMLREYAMQKKPGPGLAVISGIVIPNIGHDMLGAEFIVALTKRVLFHTIFECKQWIDDVVLMFNGLSSCMQWIYTPELTLSANHGAVAYATARPSQLTNFGRMCLTSFHDGICKLVQIVCDATIDIVIETRHYMNETVLSLMCMEIRLGLIDNALYVNSLYAPSWNTDIHIHVAVIVAGMRRCNTEDDERALLTRLREARSSLEFTIRSARKDASSTDGIIVCLY